MSHRNSKEQNEASVPDRQGESQQFSATLAQEGDSGATSAAFVIGVDTHSIPHTTSLEGENSADVTVSQGDGVYHDSRAVGELLGQRIGDVVEGEEGPLAVFDNVGREVHEHGGGTAASDSAVDYIDLASRDVKDLQDVKSVASSHENYGPLAAEALAEALQNPCQATQADVGEEAEAAKGEKIEEGAVLQVNSESPSVPIATITPGSAGPALYAVTNTQLAKGQVCITCTVRPIGFRTLLTLPVFHIGAFAKNSVFQAQLRTQPNDSDSKDWVLIAKDLFEALARILCVHPQSFIVHSQYERIRFTSIIFLESERGGGPTLGDSLGHVGGVEPVQACLHAEPMWITVSFPGPSYLSGIGDERAGFFPTHRDPESSGGEENERDSRLLPLALSAESHLEMMPPHLATLDESDVLIKCIQVCREKPLIRPEMLVEFRRKGISFDETIRRVDESNRRTPGDEVRTAIVSLVQDSSAVPKPFLGGYHVKQDPRRVLLHATTQLFMKDLDYSPHGGQKRAQHIIKNQRSRQTQTYGVSRQTQTRREGGTQTPRSDIVLDDSYNLSVVARPYFTAGDLLQLRIQKVITLQKLFRQWKARQIRRKLEADEADQQLRAAVRQRAEEAALRARANLEQLRRTDPRRANDFGLLQEELALWRASESKCIQQDTSLTQKQKSAALLAISKEEMRLLQDLERRRQAALKERQDQHLACMLEKAAAAKVWGRATVTTPETIRAAELKDLFYNLVNYNMDSPTRLDILLHTKWTVKEFPESELGKELCQLIDREADLLNRGRKAASLAGLRARIEAIFKRFIVDPEYNPEMTKYNTTAVARLKAQTLSDTR